MNHNSSLSLVIALLAILALSLSSCRYDEGPFISVKSAEKRVANSWNYDLALKNGLNITRGEGSVGIKFHQSSVGFDESGRYSMIEVNDTAEIEIDGAWSFADKKKQLVLTPFDETYSERTLNIIKLTSNEMWLTEEFANIFFEYHLIPNK